MAKKGENFVRIFKCYMLLGLAGGLAQVPHKAYEELDMACKDLLEALNPEAENINEPFAVHSPTINKNYTVRHKFSGTILGFYAHKHSADAACNWLNERYDR